MNRVAGAGARSLSALRVVPAVALFLSATAPVKIDAQSGADRVTGKDTVIHAHGGYGAGAFRRALFGDNYRELWATPITVRVLDLGSYAGGLKPLKIGGGKATKTLRLVGRDSSQYVFRPVFWQSSRHVETGSVRPHPSTICIAPA